jgi:hypothetical protein
MRRLGLGLLAAALAATVLSGCALKPDFKGQLRGYIRHTEALARTYAYSETHAGHSARIDVQVADDLSWSADYTLDGAAEMSEVVVDDQRALRVQDPGALAAAGAVDSEERLPAPAGASLAALRSGQWLVDPSGARSLVALRPHGRQPEVGDDPVADALGVLNHFDQTLDDVGPNGVVQFNPESGSYYRDLDPFPQPAPGEIRYDVNSAPALPPRSALRNAGSQAQQALEQLREYFLSEAVYVRNGVVVDLRESIDVRRRLELPDQDILLRLQDNGLKVPAQVFSESLTDQAAFIVKALNQYYTQTSSDLLRERQLDVQVKVQPRSGPITIPPAIPEGSLAGIFQRGQILGIGGG